MISVSLIGVSICSLLGTDTTLPSKLAIFDSNHAGTVLGFSAYVLNNSVALLFSLTAIISPGLTLYDGIFTWFYRIVDIARSRLHLVRLVRSSRFDPRRKIHFRKR